MPTSPKPTFFATPRAFRAWLSKHHKTASELWVGYYKKGCGKPSITWPESVDQALCFGWIDGVRKSLNAEAYVIRFSPRRKGSPWSTININKMAELDAKGMLASAGKAAFERRTKEKSKTYSYEQRHEAALSAAQIRHFKSRKAAWNYFEAQAPSYRQAVIHWVTSAKQVATQTRRLEKLMEASAAEKRVI